MPFEHRYRSMAPSDHLLP